MTENTTATDVITKLSQRSVADTVSKLTGMVSAKGMRVFAVIDQAAAAAQVELMGRPVPRHDHLAAAAPAAGSRLKQDT